MSTAPQAPAGRKPPAHIDALDGVRGIAILVVLLFHLRVYVQGQLLPDRIMAKAVELGWSGVDLFFVLSGFLITGILLDTRNASNYFSSFYSRRVLRVFPVYYWSLAILFGVAPMVSALRGLSTPHNYHAWFWTYLGNWPVWLDAKAAPALSHFWSLAVEEQFYMLWPVAVWLTPRRRLGLLLASFTITAVVLRWVLPAYGFNAEWLYRNTLSRIDTLSLGACGALLVRSVKTRNLLRNRAGFLLVAAIAGVISTRALGALTGSSSNTGLWMQRVGYSLLALSSLSIVLFAAVGTGPSTRALTSAAHRILQARLLRLFGRYSYGMYVYHVPLLIVIRYFAGDLLRWTALRYSGIPVVTILIAICFVAAMASYEVAERRILKLKRYFDPKHEAFAIAADTPQLSAAAAS